MPIQIGQIRMGHPATHLPSATSPQPLSTPLDTAPAKAEEPPAEASEAAEGNGIRDAVAEEVGVRGLKRLKVGVGVGVSLPLGLALAEGVAVSVRLRVADGDGDADGVGVALPVAASEAARAPAIGGWDGA